jgi:hypothetical protein
MEYSKRTWLNPENSPSTSSAVAFAGKSNWSREPIYFLEIADCKGKVRLHKTNLDKMPDFIQKLRKLSAFVDEYANHLEGTED